MNRRAFGTDGEQAARDHLARKGYAILAMNYRRPTGEIDLIARKRKCVVFVEVKRRTSRRFGSPAEAVTPQKRAHILRTAMLFLQERGLTDAPVRFDVIEITPGEVRHIEDAFDATGFDERG